VASLPERCREVFLLSKRDNLSHKEIAAELSISEKTVENQLAKALKVLRSSLSNSASLYDFTFILTFL
jgi:RNA polymerase sigma factor (sigma-70 family)